MDSQSTDSLLTEREIPSRVYKLDALITIELF